MDVIQFRQPTHGIYFFFDGGVNVVRRWFERSSSGVGWIAFLAILDIYEVGGIRAIGSCTVDLGDGFWGLKIARQVGAIPCPIFRPGPFDEETEITFLAGAKWDEKQNCVRPYSAVGDAKENLELLLQDRARRKREYDY